jgi:hypothetical protein
MVQVERALLTTHFPLDIHRNTVISYSQRTETQPKVSLTGMNYELKPNQCVSSFLNTLSRRVSPVYFGIVFSLLLDP